MIDVVQILTDSADARTYWKVLKNRLIKEGNETVTNCNQLKLTAADDKQVRIVWDDEEQKYYFSVTDVVGVLTEQPDARGASTYWEVLKKRLKQEGASEMLTNCKQLKLPAADGKNYTTDVADIEQLLRIIQSIPSKKAEPFKQWMAQVGSARIDQLQDPELSIEQAINDYRTNR